MIDHHHVTTPIEGYGTLSSLRSYRPGHAAHAWLGQNLPEGFTLEDEFEDFGF
jgi:hypothetical protein